MTTPNYRQLCAELAQKLVNLYEEIVDAGVGFVDEDGRDLLDRAQATLTEPEPESELHSSSTLSPAARAVFEAFNSEFDWIEDGVPGPQFSALAAALRAVAEHCVPDDSEGYWVYIPHVLKIADELEGQE